MKNILAFFIICLIPILSYSQNNKTESIIAFYNVENLFDTINNPITMDEEFTPESDKKWTNNRYQKKLNDIAKVISSFNDTDLPVIVGFAEIENKLVLEDLIKTNYLKDGNYKIVHEESSDIRGIDVALIYKTDNFEYLNHQKIPIPLNTKYKVRDILYTKGILNNLDTVHVFVNHWKSRSGGQEKTEPQRVQCAQILRNNIDSILLINKNAKILIMGDLNDEPTNKSVFETLRANNSGDTESLHNLMYTLSENGLGTHNYRGKWSILDHIIVSNNLVNNNKSLNVSENTGHIFSAEWITFTGKDGNKSPNRTYGGPNYYGGYSDHYPIYVILKKQ
ncbi:MAG: endonuclease [Bacteroidales bacterium]|jgi:predicted extracellular nuclease|nr:endonuclease [Bacteroidales bacterium]